MPFPETPRVVYAHNPLVRVICQLRFPPILRVDSEVPATYQEEIRGAFPFLSEEEALSPLLPPDLPADLSRTIKASLSSQAPRKTWTFASEDGHWSLVLARDFIALSTQSYERWEEFRPKLEMVFKSFVAEYKPSFFTRLGLRYSNLIDRNKLDLSGVLWKELLQPYIAAEYSSPDLEEGVIEQAGHQVVVALPEGQGKLGLRHGTVRKEGEEDTLYYVDNDFFNDQRTETAHVLDRLDSFHRLAGSLFRWVIRERLHDAMEPSPIS
jgi:uncharacterized protein (TIGR04255 family)